MLSAGVDCYPEHWDRETFCGDIELMKKTGVKVVRLGEFAWCRLEPRENEFDFSWLDEAVNAFADSGIDVILCTPTNCPPLWLYEKYPDARRVTRDGKPIALGIRGHRCCNSVSMKKFSERIIKKLAERYGKNPAVIAWQIDNELEAHSCCCDVCAEKFRTFLKEKYGALQRVNEVYGNVVWGGEYSSWEQVTPPFGDYPQGWYNPAYMLDWKRFCMASANNFAWFQAEIIREIIPNAVITTNTWLCEDMCDMHGMFSKLDVVSYDNYPTTRLPEDENELYSHSFHLDLMRGVKRKNFWIMEQLSGAMGCWMPIQPTPLPNMIKGYAMQAFAHGADKVLHFRWRSAAKGAEMFWHGLIDQSNVPARRFAEFAELCKEINDLQIPESAVIKNDVAILYSAEQEAALKLQPQAEGFDYYEQLKLFHDGVTAAGCGCDIISEHSDLSGYKVIIAPTLFITHKDVSDSLHRFAENGGTVVLTDRCGVKDEFNNCIMSPLPTVYADMTGCRVTEYDAVGYGTAHIEMNGKTYEVTRWCDVLETDTAEMLAVYTGRFYSGSPCLTKNRFGKGVCYYIGTVGRRDLYRDLMREILADAGIETIDNLPRNVEITKRADGNSEYIFVFNNNARNAAVNTPFLSAELAPFEYRIIKK